MWRLLNAEHIKTIETRNLCDSAKNGGFSIVPDVCFCAVHVVDDIAYDIIADFETASREALFDKLTKQHPAVSCEELNGCYDQVVAPKDSGKLFAPDIFETVRVICE